MELATGVVPPPCRDHAHRIRATVSCPPGYDIGQLADVAGRRGREDGGVEIRIVLDRVEPPAGHLRVVRAPRPGGGQEIEFSGWLGLLRALYEVTAGPGEGECSGP